jgi:LacI family transcriptional regulator
MNTYVATSAANVLSVGATTKILRERIREGRYEVGDWLPAERDLTEDLNVNRRIVRAAVTALEKEGLLRCQRYCRPIVQALPTTEHNANDSEISASRLIALVMYHGGDLEKGSTSSQQRIFWGMNQELGRVGYHGVFLDLGNSIGTSEENAEKEAAHLRYVVEHGFGGAVFYAYAYGNNSALIQDIIRRIPLVLIDRTIPGIESDFVGMQNFQAMFDATKYLIGLGHQRIAYVSKPETIITVHERLLGYLEAIHDDNQTAGRCEMVISIPYAGEDWPVFDAVFNLPADKRPTAVLCVNDYDALKSAVRLNYLGLKIPEDVSVIGCDDIIKELPGGVGLTTIAQPFEEIGAEAARLLLRRIGHIDSPPVQIQVAARLTIRTSTIAR